MFSTVIGCLYSTDFSHLLKLAHFSKQQKQPNHDSGKIVQINESRKGEILS